MKDGIRIPQKAQARNRAAALKLAAAGWKVFPARADNKRPLVKAWQTAASASQGQIACWWSEYPDAVPALPAGANGLAVVDLDKRADKDGLASYRALGLDPDGADFIVRTPSGGRHLYFAAEGAKQTGGSFGPGIDTRAGNGYVIAPGAITAAGEYRVTKGDLQTVAWFGAGPWPDRLRAAPVPEVIEQTAPGGTDLATLRAALNYIPNDGAHDQWSRVLMGLHHATGGSDHGRALAHGWSAGYAGYSRAEVDSKWRSFGKADALLVTEGSLFAEARKNGWQRVTADRFDPAPEDSDWIDAFLEGDTAPAKPAPNAESRLAFLSPGDCAALPARDYIVKGLIAPGQVGCIFGDPGAGKSVIAPALAYAATQGRETFGLRTKPGPVFYVACEDEAGMAQRVHALHGEHGDATGFQLVTGCADLFSPGRIEGKGSPDLEALRAAVKADRPSLVIIDTLAMGMPGLEENDAAGMARVVAIGRALARHGAAVIFVHHGTKAEGNTPRGHSVFNGALDFSIQVKAADQNGIVRGQVRKNRNGPADLDIAFRIASRAVGVDIDGDTVSAPICEELAAGEGNTIGHRLKPTEQAALDLIAKMAGDSSEVDEREWRAAAINSTTISGSESRDNRRRVIAQALTGLARAGKITTEEGVIRLTEASRWDGVFTDDDDEIGGQWDAD